MTYGLSAEELAQIVHRIRWDESFPAEYDGLNWNWLMEAVVDRLIELDVAVL